MPGVMPFGEFAGFSFHREFSQLGGRGKPEFIRLVQIPQHGLADVFGGQVDQQLGESPHGRGRLGIAAQLLKRLQGFTDPR
jgi:hypothetical protein